MCRKRDGVTYRLGHKEYCRPYGFYRRETRGGDGAKGGVAVLVLPDRSWRTRCRIYFFVMKAGSLQEFERQGSGNRWAQDP